VKPETDDDGAAVEAMLTPLIREHGLATVREHLEALIPRSKWQDFQRVWNIAGNIDKRLTRQRQ
jgi:hypothetical protein